MLSCLTFSVVKPSASFWNELSSFMDSRGEIYNGDNRSLVGIGRELGLNEQMVQQVQRDTTKPDQVAMKVWRKICPSHTDRLFVGSIIKVPSSTIDNIYGKSRIS